MSVRKVAAVALVGTTVWAAAACDSPARVAGSGGASANAASTSACANAPSALVGKDLKLPVGEVKAFIEGPVTVCAYSGRYEVIVRYQTGETAAEFAQARTSQASQHQSVGTVNGLGDSAYLASYTASGPISNTLGSLKGKIAIFITSPTLLGAERALMTDLLKKVS
jgi:poly(3-hydroxybutyrate) depolymerase